SPIYTQACDELGIAYWSEAAFWFIGGAGGEGNLENPGSSDYTANGYPTHVKDQAAFEDSCMQMLEEVIRIHRNHPSIMVWSMGNETFFQSVNDDSGASTNDKKRALITRMAKKCKELDPTRAVGLGGTQRDGYDKIEGVEVAGYNGDGASIGACQNPGVPNMVTEYGSHTANRSQGDTYAPHYDHVQSQNDRPIEYAWRSGVSLWCMFHHGTVAARSYGDMGIVDYYRLPLKEWYWYRHEFHPDHPEPEFSKSGPRQKSN
ncbi:MAG: glycoside hydrolase family 2 TIM barrel-domain containing protein, partial [Allobaculum sp.]|uniref:glycoside hydrolase family 2 TIM barrel-domain containing protein n=1 Tax=Allobaculum sp. TaxID=1872463 RepID=UPI00399B2B38